MGAVLRSDSATAVMASPISIAMEYSEEEYAREVLQLGMGQREALYDEDLVQQAERLGIVVARPEVPEKYKKNIQGSLTESADTSTASRARTGSSGSLGSASTGITSRGSFEHVNPLRANPTQVHTKPQLKGEPSFSEYEKYIVQHTPKEARKSANSPPPIPTEPAPSLFSVSTKKSFSSVRNGFKTKFRFGRQKPQEEKK